MFRNNRALIAATASALALGACATDMDSDMQTSASTSTPTPTPTPRATPTPTPTPNPTVGGAEMFPDRTIVANASTSADHTTLVRLVTAADLAATLSGPGPFTVFAPTNAAFGRLAAGTVDTLLEPANKASLVRILNYHVVPGTVLAADLKTRIEAGGGTAMLTTATGGTLTATMEGAAIKLTDANGNSSYITQPDVKQSNGVVHVVNGVLLPDLATPKPAPTM